ncbi:hypothetical protein EDD86DRAFT_207762 [Gorgonomyces haynaldii]|nr:hypothetical protein EDD86DRAFT_207762 [Gorgonomyces haynaldii]
MRFQTFKRFASTQQQFGSIASRLTAYAEPVIYYGRVGVEFVGQVLKHQKMTAVPNFGLAQEGIAKFISAFSNGQWRNVTIRQTFQLAAEGLKIYGFFLVGEMIGKGSVVGYQIPGNESAHH